MQNIAISANVCDLTKFSVGEFGENSKLTGERFFYLIWLNKNFEVSKSLLLNASIKKGGECPHFEQIA